MYIFLISPTLHISTSKPNFKLKRIYINALREIVEKYHEIHFFHKF